MDSPALLIILAVLLVIAGMIIGGLVAALYFQRRRMNEVEESAPEEGAESGVEEVESGDETSAVAETEDEEDLPEAPEEPEMNADTEPEPEPELPPAPPPNPHPDHVAVVRLYREYTTGAVAVEIRGDFYEKLEEIPTEDRGDFEDLINDTLDWGGIKPADRKAQVAQAAAPLAPLEAQPVITSASNPLKVGPPKPPAKPHTMLEQIDAILQKLVEFSPFREVGLRVVEDRREGVVVWLGYDRYVGIDQVPNQAAQDLIRQAVARWEAGEKV